MDLKKLCVAFTAAIAVISSANAQIVINEYCSSSTSFLDEDGDNSDWIELYNSSADSVNLKGWHLSDKNSDLLKWTFPDVVLQANSYLLVFASDKNRTTVGEGKYLHTNFNISADGESLYLTDASGAVIHKTDSTVVPNDVSRGLNPDASDVWAFFAEPTPGASNTTKAFSNTTTANVKISPSGGIMNSAVTITLSTDGGTPIYYTLDCSYPTDSSLLYTEPITVDTTTVIRAITFNENLMPAQPTTQTYIFGNKLHWVDRNDQGEPITKQTSWGGWWGPQQTITVNPNKYLDHASTFDMPVFSLTTDPENLWNRQTGIYVLGDSYEMADPHRGANYHEDWERPIHVEMYAVDGAKLLDQDAGVQIAGAYSRMNKQKSLSLHARKSYGKKTFDCKLFDEIDITSFRAFTLRDSGNDFGNTHFRDAMITHLVRNDNVDIQAYQPSVVFLNGEYWGVLNIREKLNEHYVANHYPYVDPDEVNLIVASDVTRDLSASEGTIDDYDALIDYMNSNDMTDNACYQYVATQIDLDEYIEYMVSEIYGGNDDWPHNNVKFWKSQDRGSRWRWFLYDTDQSYSIWGNQAGNDKLGSCLSERDTHGNTWANELFRNLTQNTKFVNDLSNRFADRMNYEFLKKNIVALIDSLNGNIQSEIGYHNSRWGLGDNRGNVENMKNFAADRPTTMRENLRTHFGVGKDIRVTIDVNDAKCGYIQLNSLTLKSFPWSGKYFENVPISIRAVARPGYKFVRWENGDGEAFETHAGIQVKLKSADTYKAVFEAEDNNYNSVVINEINYKSSDGQDTKDWIELYNTTAAAIDLSNWVIADDDMGDAYKLPVGTKIAPYGYLVICENQNKMLKFWPNLSNTIGNFQFGLGKADIVKLYDSEGALIDEVEYDSKNWPDANGNGYTMSLVDPYDDNYEVSNWTEDDIYGTPGYKNGISRPSHSDFSIADSSFVDVEEEPVAEIYAMCYPNPFADNVAIVWEQSADANVVVELFTAQGQMLSQLADEVYMQGLHQIDISHVTSGLGAGLYFAKVTIAGQKPVIIRMIKQ